MRYFIVKFNPPNNPGDSYYYNTHFPGGETEAVLLPRLCCQGSSEEDAVHGAVGRGVGIMLWRMCISSTGKERKGILARGISIQRPGGGNPSFVRDPEGV